MGDPDVEMSAEEAEGLARRLEETNAINEAMHRRCVDQDFGNCEIFSEMKEDQAKAADLARRRAHQIRRDENRERYSA